MATESPDIVPPFQTPSPVEAVTVDSLLHDRFVVSSGIQFHKYKTLHCVDSTEISKSNSVVFQWEDNHAFLNTRRVFAEISFKATDQNDGPLTADNAVGISGPLPHSLIDSVSINVQGDSRQKSFKKTPYLGF